MTIDGANSTVSEVLPRVIQKLEVVTKKREWTEVVKVVACVLLLRFSSVSY